MRPGCHVPFNTGSFILSPNRLNLVAFFIVTFPVRGFSSKFGDFISITPSDPLINWALGFPKKKSDVATSNIPGLVLNLKKFNSSFTTSKPKDWSYSFSVSDVTEPLYIKNPGAELEEGSVICSKPAYGTLFIKLPPKSSKPNAIPAFCFSPTNKEPET